MSFYRSQNVLCQSTFFVSDQIFFSFIVQVTNILCQTKRWFAFSRIGFCAGTKVFEEALNAVKFLGWLKKFRLAQNILGPVKGQGIRVLGSYEYLEDVFNSLDPLWVLHLLLKNKNVMNNQIFASKIGSHFFSSFAKLKLFGLHSAL